MERHDEYVKNSIRGMPRSMQLIRSMGFAWLLIAVLCMMSGCSDNFSPVGPAPASGTLPKTGQPLYGWGFANPVGPNLQGVGVTWDYGGCKDILSAGAGMLGQGQEAEDTPGWDPIPDKVMVTWYNEDASVKHQQEVQVASLIADPSKFFGTIWLVFNGKGWDVRPRQPKKYPGLLSTYAPLESPSTKPSPPVRFHWGFQNDSKGYLIWAQVIYNDMGTSSGPLKQGEREGNVDGLEPIPDMAEIAWQIGIGGKVQRQKVKVAPNMSDPAHFKGTIWLIYDGSNWHVQPKAK